MLLEHQSIRLIERDEERRTVCFCGAMHGIVCGGVHGICSMTAANRMPVRVGVEFGTAWRPSFALVLAKVALHVPGGKWPILSSMPVKPSDFSRGEIMDLARRAYRETTR